jgi:hypothetical protein
MNYFHVTHKLLSICCKKNNSIFEKYVCQSAYVFGGEQLQVTLEEEEARASLPQTGSTLLGPFNILIWKPCRSYLYINGHNVLCRSDPVHRPA